MHSTADFIVNGVITNSPDDARAELEHETTIERKALKVHDHSDAEVALSSMNGQYGDLHLRMGTVSVTAPNPDEGEHGAYIMGGTIDPVRGFR